MTRIEGLNEEEKTRLKKKDQYQAKLELKNNQRPGLSELVIPDNIDFLAMIVVMIVQYLLLLLFGSTKFINPLSLFVNPVVFLIEIMFLLSILQNPVTYVLYGMLYLAYWCWRWGYYGVDHMMKNSDLRAKRLLENEGMTWDMKFFGLIFGISILILRNDLATIFASIL